MHRFGRHKGGKGVKRVLTILCLVATCPAQAMAATTLDDPFGFAANYPEDVQAWADAVGISFDEALDRMDAREAFNDAVRTANENPDTFTGVYFTQDATTYTFHVVAADADAHLNVPTSTLIKTVETTAPRSKSELLALRDELGKSGRHITSISLNVPEGRLTVTVPSAADLPSANEAARAYADFSVAPRPRMASTCTARDYCTYWRAGTLIVDD